MYPFKVGASYSFNTHAPAILGNTIRNAVLESILNYRTAKNFAGVDQRQAQVFPFLPQGTVNRHQEYVYLLFTTEAEGQIVLAWPWINESSIEASQDSSLLVRVGNTDVNDARRIKEILALSGYNQVTITVGQ